MAPRLSSSSYDCCSENPGARFGRETELHTVTDLHSRGATAFGKQVTSTNDVRTAIKQELEQESSGANPRTARRLAIAYLLCLLVVILLSLACQLVVASYIGRSEKDSNIVNISGKQRYRSQKISKSAVVILLDRRDGLNADNYTAALAADLADFAAAYHGLLNGSKALDLPGTSDGEIRSLYRRIDPFFQAISSNAQAVLALPLAASPTDAAPGSLTASVNAILAAELEFLELQDQITSRFTRISRDHLHFLLVLTWVLHSAVILTLILEGALIFYPLIRRTQVLINERFNFLRANYVSEAQGRGMASFTIGYVTNQIRTPLEGIIHYLDKALALVPPSQADKAANGAPVKDAAAQERGVETTERGDFAEHLKGCRQNCELLQTIVEDVTDIRLLENGRMNLALERTNVAERVANVLGTLTPQLDSRKVTARPEVDPALSALVYLTDGHRIEQILLNLVAKSIHLARGGAVIVRARTLPHGLRFEVEDDGSDMLEGTRHRMFEMFDAEARHLAAGTELGLYISKLLVELMGGTIGLSSTPREGNVLWFELPLQPLDASEATNHPLLQENSIMRSARLSSGSRSKSGSRSRVHVDIATLVREIDGSMRWEGYSPKHLASDRKGEDVV